MRRSNCLFLTIYSKIGLFLIGCWILRYYTKPGTKYIIYPTCFEYINMNYKQNHFRCRQEFSCYEFCDSGPHYCSLLAESFLVWGIYVTKCDEVKCWTWAQDLLLDSTLSIYDPMFSVQIVQAHFQDLSRCLLQTILKTGCDTSQGPSLFQGWPQRRWGKRMWDLHNVNGAVNRKQRVRSGSAAPVEILQCSV